MNILAFDTCLDKMYVALATEQKTTSKVIETTKEHYHSAFLISTIANILKEKGLSPNEINILTTNIGPGSFTGIRACTTVARVFAQGVETIKTVGASSLEILSKINKTEKPTLVALDARKEMAYVAIYENNKEILAPQTILLEDVKKIISENDYYIVTDNKLQSIIGGVSYQQQDDDFGKYLIEIARDNVEIGCHTDWKKLHPLYIQPPPVTVKKVQAQ